MVIINDISANNLRELTRIWMRYRSKMPYDVAQNMHCQIKSPKLGITIEYPVGVWKSLSYVKVAG